MARDGTPLPPGSTIGILGGGQLGRMTALAAARLGYRCHVFCPDPGSPLTQVTDLSTIAAYDDEAALARFAEAIDVVTFEFENVPHAAAAFLDARVPVRPSPRILAICQDRLREKDFLNTHDVATARYAEVSGPDGLERALRDIGRPAVLKTTRLGYDGKGQVSIQPETDARQAWEEMLSGSLDARPVGILEGYVDFLLEISVIVAREPGGSLATFVPVENLHRNHILDQTIVPARIGPVVADRAEAIARHIAESLELEGILAVEMFVTDDERVLVNELAPRPHNSGHWTIDAAVTSQFEQVVRAIAGLPLGSTDRLADAVMKNLLGDEAAAWRKQLSDPMAKLHLYGKRESRPGRKMGHVTRIISRR